MQNSTTRSEVQMKRARLKELIELRMQQLGIDSYQDFADHFGIGRSTLYELLRGRTRTRGALVLPRAETMIALARALDKPLHEVLYDLLPDAPGADQIQSLAREADAHHIPVKVAGWV